MKVHLFKQAMPASVLQAVCQDADALANCSNFWVPKDRILEGPSACLTPAELVVCLLYQYVAHLLPDNWQGAEYWVQVYQPGVGLGFHFDKDEHLLKATGEMVHPIWSSILYLTGSTGPGTTALQQQQQQQEQPPPQQQQQQQQQPPPAWPGEADDWDGIRQAPTVILDQLFDAQRGCPVPAAPSSCVLLWPLKGSYCLFDGALGHGVLDSCSGSRRATLLVNWWSKCPQAVGELQDAAIEQQHLTHLAPTDIQGLLQNPSNTSGTRGTSGSSNRKECSSSCTATSSCSGLQGVMAERAPANSSQQHQHHQQQQQQQQMTQPADTHVHTAAEASLQSEPGSVSASVASQLAACSLNNSSSSSSGSAAAASMANGTSGLPAVPPQGDEHSSSSSSSSSGDGGGCCKQGVRGSAAGCVQQQHEQVVFPCCQVERLPAGEEADQGEGEMHLVSLVDAVLEAHGLTLTGPHAVSAVKFQHPGFVLYPVQAPHDNTPGAEDERVQTLAAFVDCDMLGSEEESDESDE